jgi:hypothetical protein
LNKLTQKEKKPFLDPVVSEDLVNQFNRKLIGFSKKTNTFISGGMKFDFNYGIAYCNGYIAFRVISGTPVLVTNLMGAKKEIKRIRKILDLLKIKPKEIDCKYGLCRINEEIRDLVLEKTALKVGRDTLYQRSLLNNQISFLRHIGSLCSIQDSIDSLRLSFFKTKRVMDPSDLIKVDDKVAKLKKLMRI